MGLRHELTGLGLRIMVTSKKLRDIVSGYKRYRRLDINRYLRHYRRLTSLVKAIEDSALAIAPSGKRHPHQRRLKRRVLVQVKRKLLKRQKAIKACTNFDRLIKLVGRAGGKGFGKLAIYDTALRIGSALNLLPSKMYLHAGTRQGARVLGLDISKGWIRVVDLPRPLRKLKPFELEDLLCIYKDNLKKIQSLLV